LATLAQRTLHSRLPSRAAEPAASAVTGLQAITRPSRRQQLLTAATELFSTHGYQRVSMADIGSAAGITGPSVYRHFSSKAALLAAICNRAADRLTTDADRALHNSGASNEADGLRGLIESYSHTLTGSAELAVSFSTAPQHIDSREQSALIRVQRDYVEQWLRLYHALHPELSRQEVKITVHAALTIANDLSRTGRIATRVHLRTDLVTAMSAVLDLAE